MAEDTLLSDDLLRELVAVGQVDVLVGVPTMNHASTIANVVRAVQASFATYFPRQRTVLINPDAGSTDGTPAIVRDCGPNAGSVTSPHGLRTTHRISAPNGDLPGKGSALRQIFASADLLQAPTVVVLDPDVANVTPEWVAALARPVRDQQFDLAVPVYPRALADGLLVTQLLRPLVRAMYGRRLREPFPGEFGCSGGFAASCVEDAVWDSDLPHAGVPIWVTGAALAGPFKTCQTWLGPRLLVPDRPRPSLQDLFRHVVGAAFATLGSYATSWLSRTTADEVPLLGGATTDESELPSHDPARLVESFSRDVRDLEEVLGAILTPGTLARVKQVAEAKEAAAYPDDLWAATVCEFLVAYHRVVMSRDHITQALVPLYLARTGTFLMEHAAGGPAECAAALEALCVQFEQFKPHVVERWNQPA